MARSFKNDKIIIKTPRGSVVERAYTKGHLKGKIYLRIEWANGFGPDWSSHLQSVQAMFDNEVIKVTEPYVPMDTGLLKNTAPLASDIGGGEIVYSTPYAAAQYYRDGSVGSQTGSLRGPYWGDRMKADKLSHLENFARKAVSEKK